MQQASKWVDMEQAAGSRENTHMVEMQGISKAFPGVCRRWTRSISS